MNGVAIGVICILTFLGALMYFRKNAKVISQYELDEDRFNLKVLTDFVKLKFNDILKTNLYELNLNVDEFEKRTKNRSMLRKALKTCGYGDINAKNYVKSFIRDILVNLYGINENNINKIIDFDSPKTLTAQDKFEILLIQYKKKYLYNGLEKLLEENQLVESKNIDAGSGYCITAREIEEVYVQKVKKLNLFEDKLEIIVQRIYQNYKGYGVVDEIRDMRIDGISGGVSGIPPSFQDEKDLIRQSQKLQSIPMNYDSVWLFFKGKTVHLSFLSFGSERELIRVCKNIYRYNNPGQLSESNGYKVNEMKDGSRVVVARPPFCESWVFFVRKFDSITKTCVEELIRDENHELPIQLIQWLIKGSRITAVTGCQGSGKTTLLMSIIQFINPSYTLRIQEMSFELQLRKIYPNRNIVTFRETSDISAQEGLNLQKKTDGVVNVLGEVAEAGLASLMIQMAQVASLFTLFTHHAKTTEHLVLSIRNNLLQTGAFHNEKIAEQQVVDVINFDIHLNKTITGHRYIERITEVIPLLQVDDYPCEYKNQMETHEKMDAFMDTMKEFFVRMTDRKSFETRDIVRFENGKYCAVNPISEKNTAEIKRFLNEKERIDFDSFRFNFWRGNEACPIKNYSSF